ncbi:MAG TPA: hypothetical protein VGD66_10230 [Allosphingosinicella sp.]|jgi:hypothetical protein
MSHIPNAAMPHAKAADAPEPRQGGALKKLASEVRDRAREHPKTAIAAGAAVVAGAIAAAAIPLVRSARGKSGGKSDGGSSGGSASGGAKAKKKG